MLQPTSTEAVRRHPSPLVEIRRNIVSCSPPQWLEKPPRPRRYRAAGKMTMRGRNWLPLRGVATFHKGLVAPRLCQHEHAFLCSASFDFWSASTTSHRRNGLGGPHRLASSGGYIGSLCHLYSDRAGCCWIETLGTENNSDEVVMERLSDIVIMCMCNDLVVLTMLINDR